MSMTDEEKKAKKRAYAKAYHETHKVEIAARAKAHHEAHRAEDSAYAKSYYEVHKAEFAAHAKSYYEAHKAEFAANAKAYREAHRAEEIARQLYRHYKISHADYNAMLAAQSGVCAVCGSAPNGKRLFVDHDHATGRVRGLLCHCCNMALGYAKEDINILLALARYLGWTGIPATGGLL